MVRIDRRPVEHVKGVEKDKCKIYARVEFYRLVVWSEYYATKHVFIQAGRIKVMSVTVRCHAHARI